MKIKMTVLSGLLLAASLTSVSFASSAMLQLSNQSQTSVEITMSGNPGQFSEFLGKPVTSTTEPLASCVLGANSNTCTNAQPSLGVEYAFAYNNGNDAMAVEVESAKSGEPLCAFTLVFGASPSVTKPVYTDGNSSVCPVDGDGSYLHVTVNP